MPNQHAIDPISDWFSAHPNIPMLLTYNATSPKRYGCELTISGVTGRGSTPELAILNAIRKP